MNRFQKNLFAFWLICVYTSARQLSAMQMKGSGCDFRTGPATVKQTREQAQAVTAAKPWEDAPEDEAKSRDLSAPVCALLWGQERGIFLSVTSAGG